MRETKRKISKERYDLRLQLDLIKKQLEIYDFKVDKGLDPLSIYIKPKRDGVLTGLTVDDIAAEREDAAKHAYRETLKAVIEALGLKEYKDAPNLFWDDIQTALEVRKERKAQEEREATERKVASLTGKSAASPLSERVGSIIDDFASAIDGVGAAFSNALNEDSTPETEEDCS